MIRKARTSDIISIIKILPKKVVDKKTHNILKKHIRDGIVFVMEDNLEIVGVSAILRAEKISAWTYYYIKPEYRGKPCSFNMFFISYLAMEGTTILIKSKSHYDKETFEKYLVPYKTSKTVFEFVIDNDKIQKIVEFKLKSIKDDEWVNFLEP